MKKTLGGRGMGCLSEDLRLYEVTRVLPEALESWPVDLIARLLPRHMEIIYEINHRFLEGIRREFLEDRDLPARLSLIQEEAARHVRMAHLAIIGSHAVNGVAGLHSRILKQSLFRDFDRIYPGKLTNVTNGITPRRWLYQANPALAQLISDTIGTGWIRDLDQLSRLILLPTAPSSARRGWKLKRENKSSRAISCASWRSA